MYCKYCGKEIPEGARFCAGCGKPVEPAGQSLKSEKKAEKTKREWKGTNNGNKGKTGLLIAALAAVCCIAAIICIAVSVFGKKAVWVVSEHISYNKDGTVSYREKYTYDEEGMLISVKEFSGNTLTNKINYSYEESRKGLKRIGKYSQTGGTARSEEILDKNGNVIVEKYFNADGKCYSWTEYEYDDEGNQLLMESYDSDGNLEYGFRSKYDKNGNLERMTQYNDDRNKPHSDIKVEFEYDKDGKAISAVGYENGEEAGEIEFTYTYDRKGRIKSREMTAEDGYMLWEYDEDGNLVHQESEDIEYDYEYDDAGNRISSKIRLHEDLHWDEYSYIEIKE